MTLRGVFAVLGESLGLRWPLPGAEGELAGALGWSSGIDSFDLCCNFAGDRDGSLRLLGGVVLAVPLARLMLPGRLDFSGDDLSGDIPVAFARGVDAARPCVKLVDRCCAPGFADPR